MKQEKIGVCVLIFNDKNEILLGERLNSYKAGYLGVPGGRLESRESLLSCARREVFEETGLKIEEFDYVGVVRELQEDSNFIHFAFVAKAIKETTENREPNKCIGWEWYSLDRLPENVMPGHLAAISMFKNKTTLVDLNNA